MKTSWNLERCSRSYVFGLWSLDSSWGRGRVSWRLETFLDFGFRTILMFFFFRPAQLLLLLPPRLLPSLVFCFCFCFCFYLYLLFLFLQQNHDIGVSFQADGVRSWPYTTRRRRSVVVCRTGMIQELSIDRWRLSRFKKVEGFRSFIAYLCMCMSELPGQLRFALCSLLESVKQKGFLRVADSSSKLRVRVGTASHGSTSAASRNTYVSRCTTDASDRPSSMATK